MSTRVAQQSVGEDAPRTHPLKSKLSSGLLRKLTTKLKPPVLHPRSANPTIASPPTSPIQPSTRRPVIPAASTDVAAVKRRQAALQQCGLVPLPSKDLSQLEEELDRELSHVVVLPNDQPEQGELTTAEKIRREWQAKNETQPEKQGGLDPKVGTPKSKRPLTRCSVPRVQSRSTRFRGLSRSLLFQRRTQLLPKQKRHCPQLLPQKLLTLPASPFPIRLCPHP
ncbi:hypothetical protein BDM02DRAFT_2059996 [Thelephora ganbajun]|uniref:Uncharacterized protein n=1 Tax=Thelephora ganbajun TaxID=370292 RepID=A0ACB6ZGX7_THEGA|nr:hypothetical protein BDM02DRAFT_2059996 [Thelephora ganbajun]